MLAGLLLLVSAALGALFVVEPSQEAQAPYPEWAHYHMVWRNSETSNQTADLQLVRDYLAHNISVGGMNVDSAWATGFNNFVWDTKKFPDAGAMVDEAHALGVRVIAWATSMIDTDAPNFAFAKQSGFLVSGGALVKWWHGRGGFLDFTYPAAAAYWKSLMDQVLVSSSQLDGFKCDGTDPYILELDLRGGARGHDGRRISYREYADLYYETFLNHSRTRNPYAIVWSRPVDSLNDWVYLHFSPRSVSFSGWVGDQDPTFPGLKDALNNLLRSAWAGYVSFGSDTGGYRCCGSPDRHGRTRELLLRWAQLNSLMGLFENGGDNEHRPWMFDSPEATTRVYKQWVDAHQSLSAYLLSAGTVAYLSGNSTVRPVASKPLFDFDPSTYAYFLGPSIFVEPVLVANVSSQRVRFPAGQDYVDWFDQRTVYHGGTETDYPVPLDSGRYPVFHVRGHLLPLVPPPASNAALFPAPPLDAPLALLLPCPRPGDRHRAVVRRYLQLSQEAEYEFSGDVLRVSLSAHPRRVELRVTGLSSPPVALSAASGRALRWRREDAATLSVSIECNIGEEVKIVF